MDTSFEQVHVDLGLTARKVFIHKLDDDVSRRGHDFPSIQVLRSFSRAVYLPVAYTRKPLAGGGRPRKRGPPPDDLPGEEPGDGAPWVSKIRRADDLAAVARAQSTPNTEGDGALDEPH